jgi:hypothetical protein
MTNTLYTIPTLMPEDQARRIAYGNAERLFGGRIGE